MGFFMNNSKVAILIVIDAVGISTIEHLIRHYDKKIKMPNLSRLGIGTIVSPDLRKRFSIKHSGKSYVTKVTQVSASADSLVGHREMMGVIDNRTYELFYNGFPQDYLAELEKRTGRKTFFNKMAGGIEAIELNADEHEKTGNLIVYASKCDPLIQIAMNENVVPVKEQHFIADTAFAIAMEMKIPVTRAIARSYIRTRDGEIIRTSNRHDAVLPIEQKTLVDILYEKNVWTVSVGKTSELVNTNYHEKIKLTDKNFIDPKLGLKFVHPKKKDTNPYVVQGIVNALVSAKTVYRPSGTFIFANLVDTDSVYGHTRDIKGAIKCLEEIDRIIPVFEKKLSKGDLLVISADHGMEHKKDYGYHSNEPIPLIAERIGSDAGLGGIKTARYPGLLNVGSIVAQFFDVEKEYKEIIKV